MCPHQLSRPLNFPLPVLHTIRNRNVWLYSRMHAYWIKGRHEILLR